VLLEQQDHVSGGSLALFVEQRRTFPMHVHEAIRPHVGIPALSYRPARVSNHQITHVPGRRRLRVHAVSHTGQQATTQFRSAGMRSTRALPDSFS
jgi:hypothetical protein